MDEKKTQYERMLCGLIYDPNDEEIVRKQSEAVEKMRGFNSALPPSGNEDRERLMKESFAECGEGNYIEPPFYANWGGAHLHFGSGIYANFCLTLVDDGNIYVGDNVLFGPNVTVATANHPIDPDLRRKGLQYVRDVHIGENAWIGAQTVILPGVTIGKNTVIGAGSVVTRDIPDNTVAFGNPCRVVREIGERDREFYYRSERIDREDLGDL